MCCLLSCSWHLVNSKTRVVHACSAVGRHLGLYEVPEQMTKLILLLPKKTAAAPFTSRGAGNTKHLLRNQAACTQGICVGLKILARVFYFVLFTCTQPHATCKTVPQGGVQLHKVACICARPTIGGNPWVPPLSTSHFNTIPGNCVQNTACNSTCLSTAVKQVIDQSTNLSLGP